MKQPKKTNKKANHPTNKTNKPTSKYLRDSTQDCYLQETLTDFQKPENKTKTKQTAQMQRPRCSLLELLQLTSIRGAPAPQASSWPPLHPLQQLHILFAGSPGLGCGAPDP